ncbi:hypothetical protein F0U61_11690 [Archangium violaceum]|uniref:hypothetical protein n=1 Tax=Archangium violaceum TaxID=83451 RepID=UPI002B284488|nr:hypothetical protein F0U61_11690 [Archangium violaceum]
MADTPKIPTGRTKEPTDKGRDAPEMTNVGDDQYVPDQRGQNFQPRNAGAMEDSIDQAAARVARDINERARADVNPGPSQDTAWEARVEEGEEWEEQADKDPVRNHDVNEDVYKREAPANETREDPSGRPGRR